MIIWSLFASTSSEEIKIRNIDKDEKAYHVN